MTGTEIRPVEVRILRAMDGARLKSIADDLPTAGKIAQPNMVPMTDSAGIKNLMQRLGAKV
jgi:hypothetical protein